MRLSGGEISKQLKLFKEKSLDVSATILTLNSEPALYPTLIIFNDVGYFIAFAEDCATLPIAK